MKVNKLVQMCFLFALSMSQVVQAGEISGVVEISDKAKEAVVANAATGVLYIFAKTTGSEKQAGAPPVAVLKIEHPQFPQKFVLSEKNTMMPGAAFEGPFVVMARYAPNGDAMDKSGPNGQDTENTSVKVGFKKIKIVLK